MQKYDTIKLEILACRRGNTALRFLGNITKYAKATPWISAHGSAKSQLRHLRIYYKHADDARVISAYAREK
ncbi:MAG: hypothetical protein WC285_02085 [Candidatus Gracilibacteria bacterium]|jgi:hypothetical protein